MRLRDGPWTAKMCTWVQYKPRPSPPQSLRRDPEHRCHREAANLIAALSVYSTVKYIKRLLITFYDKLSFHKLETQLSKLEGQSPLAFNCRYRFCPAMHGPLGRFAEAAPPTFFPTFLFRSPLGDRHSAKLFGGACSQTPLYIGLTCQAPIRLLIPRNHK